MAFWGEGNFSESTAAANNIADNAASFRKNLAGYKQSAYETDQEDALKKLGAEQQGIRRAASGRGLLYSGVRQGAEAASQGGMAAALAQRRADINASADEQSLQNQSQAAQAATQEQALRKAAVDQLYRQGFAQGAQQRGMAGQIIGAVGSVGGTIAGGA